MILIRKQDLLPYWRLPLGVLFLSAGSWFGPTDSLSAERHAWQNNRLEFRRLVPVLSDGAPPAIVVSDFWGHGQLGPDRMAHAVYPAGKNQPVPSRFMQLGPGDLCRLAFQTLDSSGRYLIYYGGDGNDAIPEWTETAGLVLETRHWKDCNLRDPESVRDALEASQPIGSDYVEGVFHRQNPFASEPAPFLSRYSGTLFVTEPGSYQFFTSSQDCSFLAMDGKEVVAAPGRHGPIHVARFRGTVTLTAGPHPFEYLHAAQGNDACMVAAWQPPGAKGPTRIPPERFQHDKIMHHLAGELEHRTERYLPDFQVAAVGEVPLTDDSVLPAGVDPDPPIPWLIRVQFTNQTPRSLGSGTRFRWDFGDGQTSDAPAPSHIYLHPGIYQISLAARHRGKWLTTTNRITIARPVATNRTQTKSADDTLADYLLPLTAYDPAQLDSTGLLLLIRTFLEANDMESAFRAASAAFQASDPSQDTTRPRDDTFHWNLACWLGTILRDRRHDPEGAFRVWHVSSQRIGTQELAAACAVEAADIAVNELLARDRATPLLEFASARLADKPGDRVSQLHRIRGDWHARAGDADAARAAYRKSVELHTTRRRANERDAWRGARSRSTEAVLHEGKLDAARDELRAWLREFPADKEHGYFSLLLARYWIARGNLPAAIAVAEDLRVVNPDSPYADQLVFIMARCERKRGNTDRAIAVLESLRSDYPGSPLVPQATDQIQAWKEEPTNR